MFIYTRLYRSNLYTIDTHGMLKRIYDGIITKHEDQISKILGYHTLNHRQLDKPGNLSCLATMI